VSVDSFLDLIQELRSNGAEALQVNQTVRLVASSAFDDATGGLMIDGTLVEAPYVIDAIGQPETLDGAVTFARGPQDALERNGARVQVAQLTQVEITAVRAAEDDQ
jgi:uncharacterized protein YlxW (UPF0749 family)